MNRKCLIWLGETLLAREKKLNSCLNRKSNNHRGEIEDFTNKEPFFFSIDKINLFNLNPSILSYKQDYRYIREIDTDASMNTRTIERLDRIFIKAYLHEPFLCHTHDDVRLTRELPATVDQFNIYHGGIIKVQSSKKWLVPRSSKWRGATISFPFFFLFFLRNASFFLIASSASSSISPLFSSRFLFQEIIVKGKIIFTIKRIPFSWKLSYSRNVSNIIVESFFFLIFKERGRRGKIVGGVLRVRWTISDSQLSARFKAATF